MNPLAAQSAYQFQICPVFLTGGIAALSGGTIPILSLLNPGAFPSGVTGLADPDFGFGDSLANWTSNPGASIQKYELGRYPFANQVTAANAIITEPLNVSLTMIVVFGQGAASVPNRQAVITSLKQTLDSHSLAGGTYTLMTISYTYENAILRDLVDASDSSVSIPQWRWQWDFEIPLVSQQDATNVSQRYNNLMGQLSNGQVVQPNGAGNINWSQQSATTANPGSTAAPTVVPATQGGVTLGGSPSLGGPSGSFGNMILSVPPSANTATPSTSLP